MVALSPWYVVLDKSTLVCVLLTASLPKRWNTDAPQQTRYRSGIYGAVMHDLCMEVVVVSTVFTGRARD